MQKHVLFFAVAISLEVPLALVFYLHTVQY